MDLPTTVIANEFICPDDKAENKGVSITSLDFSSPLVEEQVTGSLERLRLVREKLESRLERQQDYKSAAARSARQALVTSETIGGRVVAGARAVEGVVYGLEQMFSESFALTSGMLRQSSEMLGEVEAVLSASEEKENRAQDLLMRSTNATVNLKSELERTKAENEKWRERATLMEEKCRNIEMQFEEKCDTELEVLDDIAVYASSISDISKSSKDASRKAETLEKELRQLLNSFNEGECTDKDVTITLQRMCRRATDLALNAKHVRRLAHDSVENLTLKLSPSK